MRPPAGPELGPSGGPLGSGLVADPPLDRQAAATYWRWIGRMASPESACPVPLDDSGNPHPDWTAQRLLPLVGAPTSYDVYCLFLRNSQTTDALSFRQSVEALGVGAAPPPLQAMVDRDDLESVETDTLAFVPAPLPDADPSLLEAALWRSLRDRFEAFSGRVELAPLAGKWPVQLAVIDTHPTDKPWQTRSSARSGHGYTLLNMAQRLVCDPVQSSNCIVQLRSRLGLAYYYDALRDEVVRDVDSGGEFGAIADLAVAIRAEVAHWWNDGAETPLVLNISAGWDRRYGGEGHVSDLPLEVRAVYDALRDARCRGVTILAAAGNTMSGPNEPIGAWLPAAWADRPAPDVLTCTEDLEPGFEDWAIGRDSTAQTPAGDGAPLLEAVAGIDARDRQLANASPGSLTRIVAYGDHGVVGSGGHDAPTEILTGSSVPTIVVSASAAAVSYYWPDGSSAEVIDAVYEGGVEVGLWADLCPPASSSLCEDGLQELPVRRVSVCSSVRRACQQEPEECLLPQPLLTCPAPPPVDFVPALPVAVEAQFEASAHPVDLRDFTAAHDNPDVCGMQVLRYFPAAGAAVFPCALNTLRAPLAEPAVHTAPEVVPCPPCVFHRATREVWIEVDPGYSGGQLGNPTLTHCQTSYNLQLDPRYPFHPGHPLQAGSQALITLPPASPAAGSAPIPDPECAEPVRLTFTVDWQSVVLNPLLEVGTP
ncbi:MAG: S8/S53 family peptidase [Acidobacteriota bacterium]